MDAQVRCIRCGEILPPASATGHRCANKSDLSPNATAAPPATITWRDNCNGFVNLGSPCWYISGDTAC